MRFVNGKFIAAFLLLLAVPAIVSATDIIGLQPTGDCVGWSVDATIRFRSTCFEADAVLVVELTDLDYNVLETQTVEATLTRDEMSYQTQVYNFAGEWTWYGPAGRYHIRTTLVISAPHPTGLDVDEVIRNPKFFCGVVSTEDRTWGSVKGIYR